MGAGEISSKISPTGLFNSDSMISSALAVGNGGTRSSKQQQDARPLFGKLR